MLEIIVNPIAGGKGGKRIAKSVSKIEAHLKERNIEYRLHYTKYKSHAITLTEQLIDEGATDIIVAGGDGTLHEVINGFKNFDKVNLGIIPCGTGNDFADTLKLPLDPVKAIDLIIDGTPKYTDFMQMPSVRGINIIGMGLDVNVLQLYSALKNKTKFGYTKCLIRTLFNFKYVEFDASLDEQNSQHYKSFIACIANGKKYGGGINICPIACPDDNMLDFLAIKEMKKSRLLGALIKLKQGKVLTLSQAMHNNCKHVKIDCEKHYVVNVDGELYQDIPFDVRIVENTLKIYR